MSRIEAIAKILEMHTNKDIKWAEYHLTRAENNIDITDFSTYDYTELVELEFKQ